MANPIPDSITLSGSTAISAGVTTGRAWTSYKWSEVWTDAVGECSDWYEGCTPSVE